MFFGIFSAWESEMFFYVPLSTHAVNEWYTVQDCLSSTVLQFISFFSFWQISNYFLSAIRDLVQEITDIDICNVQSVHFTTILPAFIHLADVWNGLVMCYYVFGVITNFVICLGVMVSQNCPSQKLMLLLGGVVAQRVECWTCDQQVVGSNPTRGKSCIATLGKL